MISKCDGDNDGDGDGDWNCKYSQRFEVESNSYCKT